MVFVPAGRPETVPVEMKNACPGCRSDILEQARCHPQMSWPGKLLPGCGSDLRPGRLSGCPFGLCSHHLVAQDLFLVIVAQRKTPLVLKGEVRWKVIDGVEYLANENLVIMASRLIGDLGQLVVFQIYEIREQHEGGCLGIAVEFFPHCIVVSGF